LEFQNQWVRIIREKIGPRENAARQQRPEPGSVVVFLTDQTIFETQEDGSARVVRHQAGDVAWQPAGTHKDETRSDATFESVEIEPQKAAGGAAAPPSAAENKLEAAIVDPKHYHVEFENDLVRVIRFPMEPHDKTLMHDRTGHRGFDGSEHAADARRRHGARDPAQGGGGMVGRAQHSSPRRERERQAVGGDPH
jgi:hypothetical protein